MKTLDEILEEFETEFLDKWFPHDVDVSTLDGDGRSMRERGKDFLRTTLLSVAEEASMAGLDCGHYITIANHDAALAKRQDYLNQFKK